MVHNAQILIVVVQFDLFAFRKDGENGLFGFKVCITMSSLLSTNTAAVGAIATTIVHVYVLRFHPIVYVQI